MFHVPSTPDSRRGDDGIDNPSTTPAGPPPTDHTRQSSTPNGGPQASSVFGRSIAATNGFAAAKSPFSFSALMNSPSNGARAPQTGASHFVVPSSSSPPVRNRLYRADERATNGTDPFRDLPARAAFSFANGNDLDLDVDLELEPRGAKRSRNGDVMAASTRMSRYDAPARKSRMPEAVDRVVVTVSAPREIKEDDVRVVNLESTLEELDRVVQTDESHEADRVLGQAMEDLQADLMEGVQTESMPASIGPVDKSSYVQALFVSSLLFQIHHPIILPGAQSTKPRASDSALVRRSTAVAIPRALLEWLRTYHNPYPEDLQEVRDVRPSATAHDRFWDTISQTLLRGHFDVVISLLEDANWSHAETAMEDGYDSPGYKGSQLSAVQHVIGHCVQVLKTCPAITDDDYDIAGSDWSLFRQRCHRALDELTRFAESDSVDRDYGDVNVFAASGRSFAAGSRRAESKVPWTIYEQLKAVYGQLLGFREEIMLSAQDWLEATIYLAVWWDGEDEVQLGASRRGFPARHRDRLIDVDVVAAYKRRLLDAFASVTDEPEDAVLGVNTLDPVQVAIGAVFEDEVEAVLKLLQRWSPLVATVVSEVACVGSWLHEESNHQKLLDGFDQDDLMVLSHGQKAEPEHISRDSILVKFAELLGKKETLQTPDGQEPFEGWELAVRVLSRLDSTSTARSKISSLFSAIPLPTSDRVDKALAVCDDLGLTEQVRSIAARYADKVASTSQSYGQALLYYARAHSETQLRSTLNLLLSRCLISSSVYPPSSVVDAQLSDLLSSKTGLLTRLARADVDAARLLADTSSGYATLHRFYSLRDETDEVSSGPPRLSNARHTAELSRALVALVDSASAPLRGGLHDPSVAGVVGVDALLVLLAEALPLLGRVPAAFTESQLVGSLLGAAEDLLAAPSAVYEKAEAMFQAALADVVGTSPSAPASGTGRGSVTGKQTGFALVDSQGSLRSEDADGDVEGVGHSGDGAGRQWDWRRAVLLTAGKGAKGEDVLRLLRVGVAREVGRLWVVE